jgi:hypothetical protein
MELLLADPEDTLVVMERQCSTFRIAPLVHFLVKLIQHLAIQEMEAVGTEMVVVVVMEGEMDALDKLLCFLF